MANGRISVCNPLLEIRVRRLAFRDSRMRACQLGAIFFRRMASPAASTTEFIAVSLCLKWQYSISRKGCSGGDGCDVDMGVHCGFRNYTRERRGIVPIPVLAQETRRRLLQRPTRSDVSPNTKQMPAPTSVWTSIFCHGSRHFTPNSSAYMNQSVFFKGTVGTSFQERAGRLEDASILLELCSITCVTRSALELLTSITILLMHYHHRAVDHTSLLRAGGVASYSWV